jgi:hypothetical protein
MKFLIKHDYNFTKIVLDYNFANDCRYEIAAINACNSIYRLNLRTFSTARTSEKSKKAIITVSINVRIYSLPEKVKRLRLLYNN